MSSFPSSSFDQSAQAQSTNEIDEKDSVKELLKTQIFLGRYIERRLVNNLIGYRDVVLVSEAESEFVANLLKAKKMMNTLKNSAWIGITDNKCLGTPEGTCLWVELVDQPFGLYWFQIKTVYFRDYEVILKLKCMKHISEKFLKLEPSLLDSMHVKSSGEKNASNEIEIESIVDIIYAIKKSLTISNILEILKFLIVLVIGILQGSVEFVKFLGIFSLSLIREASHLTASSTPILLGLLDFFSKIIGGFYLVLSMVLGPNRSVTQSYPEQRTRGHGDRPLAVQYDNID